MRQKRELTKKKKETIVVEGNWRRVCCCFSRCYCVQINNTKSTQKVNGSIEYRSICLSSLLVLLLLLLLAFALLSLLNILCIINARLSKCVLMPSFLHDTDYAISECFFFRAKQQKKEQQTREISSFIGEINCLVNNKTEYTRV